jgi:hypothetical protein
MFRADSARVTVEFRFGEAAPAVRGLRVDYLREGDGEGQPVAYLAREYGAGGPSGPTQHELRLDTGRYVLLIGVRTDGGVRQVRRVVHAGHDGTLQVDLEPELGSGAGAGRQN